MSGQMVVPALVDLDEERNRAWRRYYETQEKLAEAQERLRVAQGQIEDLDAGSAEWRDWSDRVVRSARSSADRSWKIRERLLQLARVTQRKVGDLSESLMGAAADAEEASDPLADVLLEAAVALAEMKAASREAVEEALQEYEEAYAAAEGPNGANRRRL